MLEAKRKRRNARERKVLANWEDPREEIQENIKVKSPTSTRKMQKADEAEDSLNPKRMETSEECGSSGMWRISRTKVRPASVTHAVRRKKARAAQGADPSSGEKRRHPPPGRSKYWVSEDLTW